MLADHLSKCYDKTGKPLQECSFQTSYCNPQAFPDEEIKLEILAYNPQYALGTKPAAVVYKFPFQENEVDEDPAAIEADIKAAKSPLKELLIKYKDAASLITWQGKLQRGVDVSLGTYTFDMSMKELVAMAMRDYPNLVFHTEDAVDTVASLDLPLATKHALLADIALCARWEFPKDWWEVGKTTVDVITSFALEFAPFSGYLKPGAKAVTTLINSIAKAAEGGVAKINPKLVITTRCGDPNEPDSFDTLLLNDETVMKDRIWAASKATVNGIAGGIASIASGALSYFSPATKKPSPLDPKKIFADDKAAGDGWAILDQFNMRAAFETLRKSDLKLFTALDNALKSKETGATLAKAVLAGMTYRSPLDPEGATDEAGLARGLIDVIQEKLGDDDEKIAALVKSYVVEGWPSAVESVIDILKQFAEDNLEATKETTETMEAFKIDVDDVLKVIDTGRRSPAVEVRFKGRRATLREIFLKLLLETVDLADETISKVKPKHIRALLKYIIDNTGDESHDMAILQPQGSAGKKDAQSKVPRE